MEISLPPEAKARLHVWEENSKPVFVSQVEPLIPNVCGNCHGAGLVYLRFAHGGPYQKPGPGKYPCTYVDGEGWYQVETIGYPCPICSDRDTLLEYYWARSGLYPEERGWRVNEHASTNGKEMAVEAALEILSACPEPRGWLTIYGGFGVGKSGILKALVAQGIRAGTNARYSTAEELLSSIRETYDDTRAVRDVDVRALFSAYQLLSIDEVDRVSGTDWAKSMLMVVLDDRHRNKGKVATVLATNRPPEELEAMGFGYLASRMMSGFRVLMGGRDLREQERDWTV